MDIAGPAGDPDRSRAGRPGSSGDRIRCGRVPDGLAGPADGRVRSLRNADRAGRVGSRPGWNPDRRSVPGRCRGGVRRDEFPRRLDGASGRRRCVLRTRGSGRDRPRHARGSGRDRAGRPTLGAAGVRRDELPPRVAGRPRGRLGRLRRTRDSERGGSRPGRFLDHAHPDRPAAASAAQPAAAAPATAAERAATASAAAAPGTTAASTSATCAAAGPASATAAPTAEHAVRRPACRGPDALRRASPHPARALRRRPHPPRSRQEAGLGPRCRAVTARRRDQGPRVPGAAGRGASLANVRIS